MEVYHWRPIDDLTEHWATLSSPELVSLSAAWREQSAKLQGSEPLKKFNERLRREWAIETGIIENLYSIDRGITQLLIEKGIEASLIPHGATDKPAERIVPILKDQEEVVEGLFDFIAQRRELSTSYIKQLHQALTRHQETVEAINGLGRFVQIPLLRGEWKKQPNNPTRPDGSLHEYCPPEHVAAEMDRLIAMHHDHPAHSVPPETEAAWLHHRFTQIHPFQDGNGRIARTLASLVFLRAGWFPLVVHRDDRAEYITALEEADQGDLASLIQLFSRIQKKAFNQALSLSENVLLEGDALQQVIAAAANRLMERKQKQVEQVALAQRLKAFAQEKLESAAISLNRELSALDQNYRADVEPDQKTNAHHFNHQVAAIAQQVGYYADTRTYCSWVCLRIREERQTDLVLSFHALGANFLGLMAVSAFIEYRDSGGIDGPHSLSREIFQFSVQDAEQPTLERFQLWLDAVLLAGLNSWRNQL